MTGDQRLKEPGRRAHPMRTAVPGADKRDLLVQARNGLAVTYARYWLETFRLPKMDKNRLVADVDGAGFERRELQRVHSRRDHAGNHRACRGLDRVCRRRARGRFGEVRIALMSPE